MRFEGAVTVKSRGLLHRATGANQIDRVMVMDRVETRTKGQRRWEDPQGKKEQYRSDADLLARLSSGCNRKWNDSNASQRNVPSNRYLDVGRGPFSRM
jgi:hypothetical protein